MTMEPAALAKHLIEQASGRDRFIAAIAGPPGSGKSTLSQSLKGQIEGLGKSCSVVPMDGFHLDNSVLEERGLLARKGAPETFDAAGFVCLMRRLRAGDADVVVPGFDRERDCTIPEGTLVKQTDRILLVEGNYLLLSSTPWSELHEFFDISVFLNPGLEVLEERLVERWLDHGLDPEAARDRALSNDIPNARHVLQHSTVADVTITQ